MSARPALPAGKCQSLARMRDGRPAAASRTAQASRSPPCFPGNPCRHSPAPAALPARPHASTAPGPSPTCTHLPRRWRAETQGWTWYTWLAFYIPFFGWIRTYKWKTWLLVSAFKTHGRGGCP